MAADQHAASPPTTDLDGDCGRLRADAERNRDRIVAAAQVVFAEQGVHASAKEVARRAGVGIATLFRRFPTRDDLLAATFEPKLHAYDEAIDAALADDDPWAGFCGYIVFVGRMQVADRGFSNILTRAFPNVPGLRAQRDQTYAKLEQLIDSAKRAGRLREDFVAEDLPLLLMANAGVVAATADHAPESSDRLIGYLLRAFAVDDVPLPPPPAPRQMYRALTRYTDQQHPQPPHPYET